MSITVYTTAPDEKSAENLAKEIVVAKLGSCCNFWPVRTIYSWEGELRDDTEHIILKSELNTVRIFVNLSAEIWDAQFPVFPRWLMEHAR